MYPMVPTLDRCLCCMMMVYGHAGSVSAACPLDRGVPRLSSAAAPALCCRGQESRVELPNFAIDITLINVIKGDKDAFH